MHILISLSYLNTSDKMRAIVDQPMCRFSERLRQFVEYYSKLTRDPNSGQEEQDDENFDIDKRTIMDLCAHIFIPKQKDEDQGAENTVDQFIMSYEVGEFNDMRVEDRIKEFENEQGDLIFECF